MSELKLHDDNTELDDNMELDDHTELDENTLIINKLLMDDINENTTDIEDIYREDIEDIEDTADTDIYREDTEITNNNLLHTASYEMALNNIPEMLVPINMIILNGEINNCPVKILVDTGASTSIIFKNAIDRLNLNDLIDTEQISELQGIGKEQSLGQIWYIELKLNDNIYPISLIGSPNLITDFDMILGLNFLQSYKALLDFNNKALILNDQYKINFLL